MRFERFKILLGVIGVLLFIQFWLGISTNLFVKVPLNMPLSFLSYNGGLEVGAHIVNGVLVLASGVVLTAFSAEFKRSLITRLSVLGLFFVLSAIVLGFIFVLNGQNADFSIGMAMSFLIVYTVYFTEFYYIGRMQTAYDLSRQKQN